MGVEVAERAQDSISGVALWNLLPFVAAHTLCITSVSRQNNPSPPPQNCQSREVWTFVWKRLPISQSFFEQTLPS